MFLLFAICYHQLFSSIEESTWRTVHLNGELPNTEKTKLTKQSLSRKTGTIKEASKIAIYTAEIVHCDQRCNRERVQDQTAHLNPAIRA